MKDRNTAHELPAHQVRTETPRGGGGRGVRSQALLVWFSRCSLPKTGLTVRITFTVRFILFFFQGGLPCGNLSSVLRADVEVYPGHEAIVGGRTVRICLSIRLVFVRCFKCCILIVHSATEAELSVTFFLSCVCFARKNLRLWSEKAAKQKEEPGQNDETEPEDTSEDDKRKDNEEGHEQAEQEEKGKEEKKKVNQEEEDKSDINDEVEVEAKAETETEGGKKEAEASEEIARNKEQDKNAVEE